MSLVLDMLASGATVTEILADYPGLEEDNIPACLAQGSEMARERFVDIPLEALRRSSSTKTSANVGDGSWRLEGMMWVRCPSRRSHRPMIGN